jgi:predicted DNA-binding protein (MmcQ/YjbR family)
MSETSETMLDALRSWGMTFPGAERRSPWPEHDDLVVKDKTFAFLPAAGQPFSLSVKLPYTSEVALDLPYAKPTGYGLGKWGWVSFSPSDEQMPSLDQLKEWVEESYRSQAPRKLVRELDSRTP